MKRPLRILEGVRIAAFTQFLLGPAGVQLLADLGADVIKVEAPGSGAWERHWSGAETYVEGESAFFLLANRNLRSVALDLKSDLGHEAARRLIASSDVVIENFRPGVMERLRLGYEVARALRPDVIYASASGYGADSPHRDLPGQDLLVQAISGLAWLNGNGPDPVPVGVAAVDQHGATLLAMAVLAALYHRQRTGEGQRLEVVMTLAALDLATEPFVYHLNGGRIERPAAASDTFHSAPYGIYRTEDGHVAISMAPVARVSAALGDPPELAGHLDEADAFPQRERIQATLRELVAGWQSADLVRVLRDQGIWCGPVNDLTAALADPALQHLEPFWDVARGPSTVRLLKHPVRYGAGEPELRHVPPEIGEHTEEVLLELGFSAEQAARA